MKPDILNKDWKYVPAAKTNIKATFARLRREQRQADELRARAALGSNVAKLPAKGAK